MRLSVLRGGSFPSTESHPGVVIWTGTGDVCHAVRRSATARYTFVGTR